MRFDGFNKVWESKQIGEIAEVVGGGTPKTEIVDYWDGEIKWFTPSEIGKTKYVFDSDRHITEKGLKNSSAKLLPKDALLLSSRATVGEISIALTECSTNQGFQSLITKSNVDNDFIYYLISTIKNEFLRRSSGSTFLEINKNEIKRMPINIPELSEQKKISNLFSAIDNKIEMLEKKCEYYQDFKKYLMQRIFSSSDDKLRFDDNCQYKTKQVKDFLIESKIEGIDDINKRLTVKLNLNGITVRESKTIEIEGATKQFIRKTGQFIYGKQNLHKGAFGIIPKELDGYLTSSDIPSFDFKGGIEPKWFYYYFARKSFYEKLENLSTGTGSKRISPKEFLNIKIIVPEFKEQHKIVCLFEKFDEKINGISNQIVQMNMFKKSLLQQMFVVRINWRCNFKLAKSPSFNKHLLILKNKIIFIIIK